LYQSRHYAQCVNLADRYLTRTVEPVCSRRILTAQVFNQKQTHNSLSSLQSLTQSQLHPIHEAYLNFYMALCHDIMAREASLRNRHQELNLSEKHYLAAIAALSPSKCHQLGDTQEYPSPVSSTSEENGAHHVRRGSDATSIQSQASLSTSATSVADDGQDISPEEFVATELSPPNLSQATSLESLLPLSRKPYKRRPTPLSLSSSGKPVAASSAIESQFSSDLSTLITMIKRHLASVRELRATTCLPMHRYSSSRSRGSSLNSRPVSYDYPLDDPEMDNVRWSRREIKFRARFDPTSVRKLCAEALAEL
jgi:hypothetical protein